MNIFKSTALYGKNFEATKDAGVYFLRVYTGGFAGVNTALKRATKEARSFIEGSEYSEFEILEAKRVWLPFSCVEFLIGFRRHPNQKAEQDEPRQPPLAALSSTSPVFIDPQSRLNARPR
jgi:hypothetical protein